MSTWQQQDAQEYFSKLLDEVDKEIAKASKTKHSLPSLGPEKPATAEESPASSDSGYHSTTTSEASTGVIRNPLEGLVAQRVACVQCGHSDGLSLIPFNCLTLSLGVNAAEHDLYELLDAYSHIESIEGVQCGKCTLLKVQRLLNMVIDRARADNAPEEKLAEPLARLAAVEEAFEDDDYEDSTITERCKIAPSHKVNSTKTKQTVVARPPQSLVIHMNRSAFDENTGYMWKNGAAVRFPMTLDLGPWCLGSAGTYARVAGGDNGTGIPIVGPARADEEEWLLTPRASMIAGDKGQSKISGPIYELSAVVTHFGRHENGHYICYRRFPRSSPPTAPEGEGDEKKVSDGDGIEMEPLLPSEAEEEEQGMEWWRLSDETVYKVDEASVLGQGGVFMLFYDCVDPSSVLTAQGGGNAQQAVPGEVAATDSDASDAADEPVTPTEGMERLDLKVAADDGEVVQLKPEPRLEAGVAVA
jgi:ubiquitin carboxyl-terminal hydrolase 1